MFLGIKVKYFSFLVVAYIALVSIHFWSFQGIEDAQYNLLEAASLGLLGVTVVVSSGVFLRQGLNFKPFVLGFLFIPLLGVIGASLYHDQPIGQSLYIIRDNYLWLLYFALHIYKVPPRLIIKLILFIGAGWAFITIAQQFTYPNYYFYTRDDSARSIYRAGVYRYMIQGLHYGLFLLLFFVYKYFNQEKPRYLAFVLFGILAFYFYGTRQTALVAGVCMCCSILYLKGNAKWKNLLMLIAGALILYGFREVLFGEYIDMTSQQLGEDDNIRLLSGNFFLNDYWPNDAAKLLGNGRAHHDSRYGQEVALLQQELHFYTSDVGIIGSFNTYGIFYVINVLLLLIKGLTIKIKNRNHKYLHLFFLYALVIIIVNEFHLFPNAIPFLCMLYYLIDTSIAASEASTEAAVVADTSRESFAAQPA